MDDSFFPNYKDPEWPELYWCPSKKSRAKVLQLRGIRILSEIKQARVDPEVFQAKLPCGARVHCTPIFSLAASLKDNLALDYITKAQYDEYLPKLT